MYLALLDKYEKEVIGEDVSDKLHNARFEFALWLEKNAQVTGGTEWVCSACYTKNMLNVSKCQACGSARQR